MIQIYLCRVNTYTVLNDIILIYSFYDNTWVF